MFTQKAFLYATIASALISLASAACPNRCSGHGSCGAYDKCTCHPGFMGGDCSLRTCPHSRAWVDTAQAANDAHYWAECGNKGSCDRSSGVCECDEGFTGVGCRRMACPNDCSGHGTCEAIEELAVDTYDKRIAGTSGVTYTEWDQEKIFGCKCDPWYEGHDCSSRLCPRGDDPVTSVVTTTMKQVLALGGTLGTDDLAITYYDPYGNAWTTQAIDTSDTSPYLCANIQTALRRLPNRALDGVTVAATTGNYHTATRHSLDETEVTGTITATSSQVTHYATKHCIITFPDEPGTTGLQHLMTCMEGGRSSANGYQPVLAGTTSSCTIREYAGTANPGPSVLPLKELAECSNRGICDSSSGTCECFEGHTGLACEEQEALI